MNGAAVLIKYMGSKRSLAPKIANRISREHPGATVLDVFSGMCAVGSELANRHTLYTNDVHAFAEVVARSLFASSNDTPSATEISKLLAAFGRNKRALSAAMAMELKHEKRAIAAIDETNKWRRFRDFTKRELNRKFPIETNGLDRLEKYRACPQRFPYRLCASYFSNSYFGVEQAIEIDSIRYAIDQLPEKFRFRYLAALIHAVSHCAAAPGHFAQFLTPRDQQNTIYISNIRKRSILTRFLATLVSFPEADCLARDENRIFRSDATTLLKKQKQSFSKRDFVIYADPPYSKAQYSRYYHVLETLTLYDYPPCDGKGRYRADRFQTDFSRVTGVVRAMTDFVKACSNVGAPLYLSYPRNGLLSRAGGDLRSILKEHYDVVRLVAHEPLNHSTMGARPERPPSGLWRTFIMPDGSSKDASAPNGRLKLIRVDEVTRNERNPRQTFDPARIEQLAASLQEIGLQVPIRVYENPKSKRFPYVLLDGERRFRAAKLNNWETIQALIVPAPSTKENAIRMFNIHMLREDWEEIETAWALEQIIKETGIESDQELQKITRLSIDRIRNMRRVLAFPKNVKEKVAEGEIKYQLLVELDKNVLSKSKEKKKDGGKPVVDMGTAQLRDVFLKKYQENVESDIVELRKVGALFDTARTTGRPAERAAQALTRLVNKPDATIEEAYETGAPSSIELSRVLRDISSLPRRIRDLLDSKLRSEQKTQVGDAIKGLQARLVELLKRI